MRYDWSETDIRTALDIMGLSAGMKDKRSYLLVRCPFHGDNNPSLSIQLDRNGVWKCFAGCGNGTFTEFIYRYYENDKETARSLIRRFQGEQAYKINSIPEKQKRKEVIIPEWKEFATADELAVYRDDKHYYSLKRGISEEVCRRFELGYDRNTREVTFPIRDGKGKCIMVCRRAIDKKRFDIPFGIQKPVVYLHEAERETNNGWVVMCESIYNALTCWTHGIPAVALLGLGTDIQKKMIVDNAIIRGVMIAFDGDQAGMLAGLTWQRALKDKKLVKVVEMPTGKDVNDLTAEEFERIIGEPYKNIIEE